MNNYSEKLKHNEEIVKKFIKIYEVGDKEQFEKIMHQNYYIQPRHIQMSKDQQKASQKIKIYDASREDRDSMIDIMVAVPRIFQDFKIEIIRMCASINEVWVDLDISGKQVGELFGIPGTGNFINYRAMFIYEIRNDKIISTGGIYDHLSVLGQIGKDLFLEKDEDKIKDYFGHLRKMGLLKEN